MKREQIERVSFYMIKDIVGNPYEYCDKDENLDMTRITTLGQIYGICEMAEALIKEIDESEEE